MKVAIISSGFLPVVDGVTIALSQRLQFLSRLNHQVLVLCPDYRPLSSIYPNWESYVGEILPEVQVIGLPSEPFMGVEFERNVSRQANSILRQELETFQPDIVHVDEPDRLFLGVFNAPGVAYAREHGIPCVGFYHTNFVDYIEDFFDVPTIALTVMRWVSTQIIRRVFQSYDATLVASPITAQRVHQLGIRNVVCDRFLGVDIEAFRHCQRQPQFFQTHYKLKELDNKIKVVFLGRLTPDKGWRFTLQALTDLVNAGEEWIQHISIIVAGDGELRDEIRHRLQSLGLSFNLMGRISPSAVPALLVNSDIHVTASEKETLGLTVLESFAAGIPVIAPRAGGVVTLIRDKDNGLLFSPRDAEEFGRSLHALVTDSALRHRLGQQGQEDVASYGWSVAITTLINAWQTQINHTSN